MHKTSAWPLSQAYAALIVYASLYPFTGWRDQGIAPWAFLLEPAAQVLDRLRRRRQRGRLCAAGVPAGAQLRAARQPKSCPDEPAGGRCRRHADGSRAVACHGGAAELPAVARAPRTWISASTWPARWSAPWWRRGWRLAGAIDRWSRFRGRWFVADARGALVLLALWPFALLFPAAVPFGLGQVLRAAGSGPGGLAAGHAFPGVAARARCRIAAAGAGQWN